MTVKQKILIALILSSVTFGASAAGKLAFINPAIIIEKSPQSQAASKLLKEEFLQRETSLRAMAQKIQELESKYQTDSAIMSAENKKKSEDVIIQSKRQFQFDQKSLQEDVQSRRGVLLQEIQKSISAVILKFGKENGYDFIFTEGVAYADEAVNVTDELLKELSK
jgi:outer membrane protein|tara:strand:- start:698 stop:1195 length:498 start_codon:yes stop_codon:yes gene_type:complete